MVCLNYNKVTKFWFEIVLYCNFSKLMNKSIKNAIEIYAIYSYKTIFILALVKIFNAKEVLD